MDQVQELAEVVGVNARRIRQSAGATLNDVAKIARQRGLKWSTGKVGDLEAGRISPSFPTLFALAYTLGSVTESPVSLRDLVEAEGFIRVNDDLVVRAERIAEAVSASPVELKVGDLHLGRERLTKGIRAMQNELANLPGYLGETTVEALARAERHSSETEERVAKSVGIGMLRMHHESAYLWGDSFSAERDRRAGPDSNAQKRGRVSRELKAELGASISRVRD